MEPRSARLPIPACPVCGSNFVNSEDFRSGVYRVGDTFDRLHPPMVTFVCMEVVCQHRFQAIRHPAGWSFRPEAAPATQSGDIPPGVRGLFRYRLLDLSPLNYRPPSPRRPDPPAPDPPVPDPAASSAPTDPTAAWSRAQVCMNRLFAALADLDEAGGTPAAANIAAWPDRKVGKALGVMGLLRTMLGAEMDRLRGRTDEPD